MLAVINPSPSQFACSSVVPAPSAGLELLIWLFSPAQLPIGRSIIAYLTTQDQLRLASVNYLLRSLVEPAYRVDVKLPTTSGDPNPNPNTDRLAGLVQLFNRTGGGGIIRHLYIPTPASEAEVEAEVEADADANADTDTDTDTNAWLARVRSIDIGPSHARLDCDSLLNLLAPLTGLRALSLSVQIADRRLSSELVRRFPHIAHLNLAGMLWDVRPLFHPSLGAFRHLVTLDLFCATNPGGLATLAALKATDYPHLRGLTLCVPHFMMAAPRPVLTDLFNQRWPKLTSLYLYHCWLDEDLGTLLARNLPALRNVGFLWCMNMAPAYATVLTQCPNLVLVSVYPANDDDPRSLYFIPEGLVNKSVAYFMVIGNYAWADVARIMNHLPNLRGLHCRFTSDGVRVRLQREYPHIGDMTRG
ncbi:hypothetical protein BJ085DRAFT_28105 [Dimargaris cristalligena]|uniref:F-box domain-containing protein n=1 Tax=Dimargaris cristalligena TaxID=215637 RepID=A0A4Q0A1J8_9FUNG|nr:hypothetical protein BJ085DRAFT_28105 [Dimargaris cristalligena]|eukprot:RKP39953.1 hypothetical protein BJ085DRAFT_28105 [Dimargaris cristalligena]